MNAPAVLFFWLMVGHALADFPLQGDFVARGKNRHVRTEPPPGQKYQPVWPIVLPAHGLIHGGFVAYFTGIWWLGLCEALAHCAIDFLKCDRRFGVYTDQALHVACKVLWVVVALKASS